MKIKNLKKGNLVGQTVPTNQHGQAGRAIEDMLEAEGFVINRRGGADIQVSGQPVLEIKSRDIDAISPQTVGTMTNSAITSTPYSLSHIRDKLQVQYRVKTQNQVVVENKLYDWSHPSIQSIFEDGYNNIQKELLNGNTKEYIYGNKFLYAEKKSGSYAFRINNGAMDTLESIADSTFSSLFI